MVRAYASLLAIAVALFAGFSQAADTSKEIAVGEWSKPVGDKNGNTIRGRLVICEKPRDDDRREAVVYLDLQSGAETGRASIRIFCDFAKNDFRPEYKGGLQAELLDQDGKPVRKSRFVFSGGVPQSQWITLPRDATIRLRATPFGIHRAGELAIAPDAGNLWVIADHDPKEYFLSGTFTSDLPTGPGATDVWKGTLKLPPARIVGSVK